MMDPTVIMECHRQNLLEEADHERLIAQLPPRGFAARRLLATACLRVADWLDGPAERYFSAPETGPGTWA